MTIVVRASVPPASLAGVVRETLLAAGGDVAVAGTSTMADSLHASAAPQRFTAVLAAVFAVAVLALASVALYGQLADLVGRRRKEIGLRMALGASPSAVTRLVAGRAAVPVGIGLAVGLFASAGLGWVLDAVLFGVASGDVPTYAGVAMVVLAVASLATLSPALRALRIDPVRVLRLD
jgi:ABC-type antimicrobial peptide transport system permease subunit